MNEREWSDDPAHHHLPDIELCNAKGLESIPTALVSTARGITVDTNDDAWCCDLPKGHTGNHEQTTPFEFRSWPSDEQLAKPWIL